MIVIASGRCSCSPLPSPIAIGSIASTVVALVIRIGRNRNRLASSTACSPGIPSSRSRRIVSSLTIASLTAIPSRARMPIRDRMLIVPPVTPIAIIEPASPIGITEAMSSGSRNDSNCAARIM